MTDHELFKAIMRATQGCASDDVSLAKAVAAVRAILAEPVTPSMQEPEHVRAEKVRAEKRGLDRLDRSGHDRAE
jgi:hypothetical protein